MKRIDRLVLACIVVALVACGGEVPSTIATAADAAAPTAAVPAPLGNHLRLKIDGADWVADNEVWGAVDALGAKGSVLISGNLGQGATQQTFNLNLVGIAAPGRYRVTSEGQPDFGIAQIGNLSERRYLVGGALLAHDLNVVVDTVEAEPVRIVAHFDGTMQASDGSTLKIEHGEFHYTE